MKTVYDIIRETVEAPRSEDEKRFIAKHVVDVIDHPAAAPEQFKTKKVKDKTKIASYHDGEDRDVYEETMSDAEMKKREEIVKSMKKSTADFKKRYGDKWKEVMYATATKQAMGEALTQDPRGLEDDDIDNDGDSDMQDVGLARSRKQQTRKKIIDEASKEHLERLKAMLDKEKPGGAYHSQIRHAISSMYGDEHIPAKHRNVKPDTYDEEVGQIDELDKKTLASYTQKAAMASTNAGVSMASSKSDEDKKRHAKTIGKRMQGVFRATGRLAKEEFEQIDEVFKPGNMVLQDGSSVIVTREVAEALNNLFWQLNASNKTKMEARLTSGAKGFNEITAFAKETANG